MRMDLKNLGIALLACCPVASFAQDAGSDAVAEYEALLRDIRGLEAYNSLLERQIQTQQGDLLNLQEAIGEVPELERQLPPVGHGNRLWRSRRGLDPAPGRGQWLEPLRS